MDENHQDKTGNKLLTTENKLWTPTLSTKDQKKLARLRKDRKKTLIVVGISAAFVGVIVLIYIGFRFNWPLWILIPLMLIGIVLLILLIRVGYTAQWTGLKGKTLWDWLNLLGVLAIPLVVVGATLLFGLQQGHLADLQHQSDQTRALDQQQATILQTYMDNIQDLLLNHNLLQSAPDGPVAILAQARTLTALEGLDPTRKRILLKFLYEAGLIGYVSQTGLVSGSVFGCGGFPPCHKSYAVLSLDGPNLSGADLHGVMLAGADLSNTDLHGADLHSAFLYDADLSGTDLTGANLSNVYLVCVFYLTEGFVDQKVVDIGQNGCANLTRANLSGVDLSGKDLSGADFIEADLMGANLEGANLSGAYLRGARYNTKTIKGENAQGSPFSLEPTQWPQGFDPKAAGAICVDC